MNIEELKLNIKWWESKRWLFNLLVGTIGVYTIYKGINQHEYPWSSEDLFGIIYWGIMANVFYSFGILCEIFDWYYFKNKIGLSKIRIAILIAGILFSCIMTFFCGMMNYYQVHLW